MTQDIYNAKKVLELTKAMEKDLARKSNLLEQYKEIVDLSTIVSKTDISGRITYANEEFCETSGYTLDELLGKVIVDGPDDG